MSAWENLRDETRVRSVLGQTAIVVGAKASDVENTHTAIIPGAYISAFRNAFRQTTNVENCGFFYVIVHGVLEE